MVVKTIATFFISRGSLSPKPWNSWNPHDAWKMASWLSFRNANRLDLKSQVFKWPSSTSGAQPWWLGHGHMLRWARHDTWWPCMIPRVTIPHRKCCVAVAILWKFPSMPLTSSYIHLLSCKKSLKSQLWFVPGYFCCLQWWTPNIWFRWSLTTNHSRVGISADTSWDSYPQPSPKHQSQGGHKMMFDDQQQFI